MTRRMQRWLAFGSLAVIVLSTSTALAVSSVQAQSGAQGECPNETYLGRKMCEGFLSGKQRTYGENQNVFYDGLRPANVNEFVSTIRGYLYDDDKNNNPGTYWEDARDNDKESNNAGAATIIAAMLNKNGSDFNNINQGVAWAKTNFARWEAMSRDYDARGKVQWSVNAISNDSQGDRVKHTSGDKPSDDNYFLRTYFFTTQVIRFTGDNGAYFQIQRDCGNIFGLLGRLTEPSTTNPPSGPPPTTPPPTTPPPTTPPPTTPPPPSSADAVITQPYFRVRGGDVSAGAGMSIGGVCTPQNFQAGVVGWNRGPANVYGGAGTQYAAFVLNHLQEFATAQGSTAGPNVAAAPSGLAFANTAQGEVDVNAGLYGGKFGGADCVIDYFAGSSNVQNGDRLLSQLPGFPTGGTVPNGARLTYYVDGDLFIDSNVRFSGAYGNVNEIPSFAVVVKGDILVQNSVAQLDGIYIAQPSSQAATDGVIYTCATDNVPPFMSVGLTLGLHDACNAALTVNGSLTARQVWLMRSFGALDGEPAETINYIPELWLATQGAGGNFKSAGYDSITSLPPVL